MKPEGARHTLPASSRPLRLDPGPEARMSYTGGRLRAYLQFLAAVLYFFLARVVGAARRGVGGEQGFRWSSRPCWRSCCCWATAVMGFWLNRQMHPLSEQGLPRREGWPREMGLGLAVGWGAAVVCVLPMVVVGGIAIFSSFRPSSLGLACGRCGILCAGCALAEEIAFRGYGFQRFAHAVGPLGAALGFAAFYAIVQALQCRRRAAPALHRSLAFSLLLSTAYLRTRALWLSWGLNFGWKASRALVFGLAVNGVSSHSPVVQGDPMGPFWLSGGAFGLDGSWLAFVVLLAALPVVYRVTRDLNFRYNAPVIVPGGIPVDLDAAARRSMRPPWDWPSLR
jgi:uncharacterized protein